METTEVTSSEEMRAFFDKEALFIEQRHGPVNRLLAYRIGLIKRYLPRSAEITLLDIGCGTGHHLLALAPHIGTGIGIDFSRAMIEVAGKRLEASEWNESITFRTDDAEELKTIGTDSIDVVICLGVLEHVLNRRLLLSNLHRVLKPGGRFVCLTPNGSYLWYSLAAALHLPTRHLSTDVLLTGGEIRRHLIAACLKEIEIGNWSFVPKGDVGPVVAYLLTFMDFLGKGFRVNRLRGGLIVVASKPVNQDVPECCATSAGGTRYQNRPSV